MSNVYLNKEDMKIPCFSCQFSLVFLVILVAGCNAIPVREPTPTPTLVPVNEVQPVPLGGLPWTAPFYFAFPEGHWKEGSHSYTIKIDCPEFPELNKSWENEFSATKSTSREEDLLFLRIKGIQDAQGNSSPQIHPDQATVAFFAFNSPTKEDALAIGKCQAFISWDGKPEANMILGSIYEYK